MKSKIDLVMLLDFYGNLLSKLGKETVMDYAENDLSISEIAEKRGVSRQAIMDILKKQESKLTAFENKLQLVEKFNEIRNLLLDVLNSVKMFSNKQLEEKIKNILNVL